MELPEALKIGPAVWRVSPRTTSKARFGETVRGRTELGVDTVAQSVAAQRETLLHESLHAILWSAGGATLLGLDDEHEERLVTLLSPWLLAMLRDNPAVVEFLLASPSQEESSP